MVWIVLLACNENSLEVIEQDPVPGDDTEAPIPQPEIQVDPSAWSAVICDTQTTTVTVRNLGEGPLTVSDASTQATWTVDTSALPAVLESDQTLELSVTGNATTDVLTIFSDDPAQPEVDVQLEGTADQPPEISVLTPESGAILEDQEPITLLSQVADAEDGVVLPVSWTSDVEGVISSGLADSTGRDEQSWPGGREGGDHVLTATVTDSCGQTEQVSFGVCQQAGYDTETLDISSWHFEGSARWDSANGWLELTDTGRELVGSAFQTGVSTRGNNVTVEFQFYMGDGSGADGLAVTALDTDRMTGFLGSAGGCLGYGSGTGCTPANPALPGWTIEVDNFRNSGFDPTGEDHVAFMFDGDVLGVQAWAVLPEMEDTGWHSMRITVAAPRVTVAIDGTTYIDQDIPGDYDFPAYVGFTAATGGSTNNHLIDALTVTEFLCTEH